MSLFIDNATVEGALQHQSWNTGTTSTAVSASTQSLTVTSTTTQLYTGGTAGQIVKMPDCTTFTQIGQRYQLHNDSTQNVTVQDNAAVQLFLLGANQRAFMVCASTGSAAGLWSWIIADKSTSSFEQFTVTYPGTGLAVNYTGGNAHFNGSTFVVAGGSITLGASITNGWIYVDINGTVTSAASLPVNTMPLYQFTTSGAAVTVLTDNRDVVDQNLVWGVLADIVANTYNNTKSAGVLEKYARADHSHGGSGLLSKSGAIAAGTFTGNPKTATVTFGTAFPSVPNVVVTGSDGRSWTITAASTTAFTVSAQANQALTNPVYWVASITGESV